MGESLSVNVPIGNPPQDPGAPPAAPEQLIAGKFKSEADLEKATLELIRKQAGDGGLANYYKSLESQLGKPPEQQPGTPAEPKPAGKQPPENPTQTQVKDILAQSGLDFDSLSQEFQTAEGKLSDDSYKKLADAGFPRTLVDNYIQGQLALSAQRDAKIYGAAGGEDQYNAMIQWAAVNLSPEEKKAYNAALDGDMGTAMLAVEGLQAKYQRATGATGKLITGNATPSNMGGYQSQGQWKADMRDPRYKTDQAFRDMVADRLAKTTAF